MKIKAMAMMAGLAGMVAQAHENGSAEERTVTLCMDRGTDVLLVVQAQTIARKMFASIGVKVEWRTKNHTCATDRTGAIVISLVDDGPSNHYPGALAFALPYEGTHIQVFYDRIRHAVAPQIVPCLLAHVLVHEITHILQGINRHSESGVMKAHWEPEDHVAMSWKPLGFTEEDVKLIYRGLEERSSPLVAVNPTPASVPAQ
jgi:hypothetical protein